MRRDGGEVDNRLGSGGFEIVAAQHVDRNADIVRALFAALGGDDDVAERGARRLRFRRVWPGLLRGSRGCRSEERRVGNECVSTVKALCAPYHYNTKEQYLLQLPLK